MRKIDSRGVEGVVRNKVGDPRDPDVKQNCIREVHGLHVNESVQYTEKIDCEKNSMGRLYRKTRIDGSAKYVAFMLLEKVKWISRRRIQYRTFFMLIHDILSTDQQSNLRVAIRQNIDFTLSSVEKPPCQRSKKLH